MGRVLNKREFLKLLALFPPSVYLSQSVLQKAAPQDSVPNAKNVLVIVFDALSAKNISLYGYPRQTMPSLSRIAEKGTVYHHHYAAGNWTVPGTASLLTGTYPWTHRAFSDKVRSIEKGKESHNLFKSVGEYYRVGYSHNPNVYEFFDQFSLDIEKIINRTDLYVKNSLSLDRLFPRDNDIAPITWGRMMEEAEKGYTYSLFFAPFFQKYSQNIVRNLRADFPRGIPERGEDDYFLLEDGINWIISNLGKLQRPYLGYFHFFPPHRPYNTRREFVNAFRNDGVDFYLEKPRHPFFGGEAGEPLNLKYQGRQRQDYDEFILYADSELGRLYNALEKSGELENTVFVFTSDHGEMCERGIFGHRTPVLYQPVVQIPLVIVEPGQGTRRDVFSPTSAVDVLPTLLKITGQKTPDWAEGIVLEPFNKDPVGTDRSLYALEATMSDVREVLNPATAMLVKGNYKLTYSFGYEELQETGPLFELYDTENDPEELQNIYEPNSHISQGLKDELLKKIDEVNKPYLKSG